MGQKFEENGEAKSLLTCLISCGTEDLADITRKAGIKYCIPAPAYEPV